VSNRRTEDDFADVINSYSGVFGDATPGLDNGLKNFDAVDVGVTEDGAVFEFRCTGCGRMRQLTVEYPELVALKMRVSPHVAFRNSHFVSGDPTTWRWVRDEHKWGLVMKCTFCPYHYAVRLQPHEPEQILAKARHASLINPAGEQQVMAHVQQVRQHFGRR
jgi:hypothetical protein